MVSIHKRQKITYAQSMIKYKKAYIHIGAESTKILKVTHVEKKTKITKIVNDLSQTYSPFIEPSFLY